MLSLAAGCGGITASGRNAEGVQLFQQARYNEALKEFQEASYADASNADAYYNMAATYHRIGKQYHSPADLKMAEDCYNLCLDRNENHTACYRGLAVLLAEQGRSQEAFRLLEGWVAKQPKVGDAKVELARLCEEFGDKNAAREHLIEALAVQNDNPRTLTALAKLQEEAGNLPQALTNYQRSLAADGRQPLVAERIAALQSNAAPASPSAPAGGTRIIANPASPRRY
ncbi:MAG: tetratricopeptide repeat protein [Pirellulales bacterium]|nr:tetratricopeptide repeat protein [Pirellulales bacterium]